MNENKQVVIGSDHYGLPLKDALRDHMRGQGYEVIDMGVQTDVPVDYPDIGVALSERIADGEFDRGILVCGTGAGMAIVANKVPGVRAVCIHDPFSAERARASNNAQVVTMGSQVVGHAAAKMLIDVWLKAEFQGGRSAPKVAKINKMDEQYRADNE